MANPSDVQRQCFDAWNSRDFEKMKTLFHANYTFTGPDGKEQAGPEAGLKTARMWATAFPDGKINVQKTFTQGDVTICEFIGRGTHNGELLGVKPTGKTVSINVVNIMEIKDGKIFREREYLDMLSLMMHLGAVSMPGFKAA
jgi:steroid delta-isomerase-like uncharacterized protein